MNTYPKLNLYHILTYPLSLSPILIIFFTTIFISGGLMDRLIAVLGAFGIGYSILWFLKYAFYMLTQTAEGYADVPLFSDNMIRPFEDFRPIKLGIIIMFHIMIMGNLFGVDDTLGYLYGGLILFFVPAIISELAMENSLHKTFLPQVLFKIMKSGGSWYWISFVFYCATTFLVANIYKSDIGLFISVFITLYLIMVSFHMIGLTLYAQREKMGYATVYSPEQTQDALNDEKQRQYQRLATNIYSCHRQLGTLNFLEKQLEKEAIEAYDWFWTEIMSWEIKPKFKRNFVQLYCRQVCENGNSTKALNRYIDYSTTDNEFALDDKATLFCLLNAAIQCHRHALIKQFSKKLLNESQDNPFYQKTLITLIKYFTEIRPNDRQASHLLKHLVNKFPEMNQDKMIQQYQLVLHT